MTKPDSGRTRFSRRGGRGFISLLALWFFLSTQTCVLAATTPEPPAPQNRVTVFNILLFYAGVFGVLVGAATGWVTLLALPSGGTETPLPPPDRPEVPSPAEAK